MRFKKRLAIVVAAAISFVGVGLNPAIAVDVRVVDIVEVTWSGAGSLAGDGTRVASIIDTEVNSNWKKFTTLYGDVKDQSISFVSGKILEEPILLPSKMACTGSASTEFLNSIRSEAYKRLGIPNNYNRYLVVLSPKAGCIWSGRAQMGGAKSVSGTIILHDSISAFVITHEIGHTFGLGHSNFLRCDNLDSDGPWGQSCKGVEYGGTIDVMGNVETTSPLNTYHQWRMGLISESQIKQVMQSEIINLAPSDFAEGIKAIYMRDGKSAYWIEYRRKSDGSEYKPGLAIYRLDPPPVSALVSPNPEDAEAPEFDFLLGTDVWMLNLDSYRYKDSRSLGGSMTSLTATTYSGNISFNAVASETGAIVTVNKKADSIAPPMPPVVPFAEWNSPNMAIIKGSYEDNETAITGFEAEIDGVIQTLKASELDGWLPTYLNPFTAPKTVYLRDLPEGTYSFSLRSVDLAGNKSTWSPSMDVSVDRGHPVVTNDFAITAANAKEISLSWKGATDSGSGICQVNIVDEDGLIITSSSKRNEPVFKFGIGTKVSGDAQIFDCTGNGMTGNLRVDNTYIPANKSSRTGKWSPATSDYGLGAMKCMGKCTASMSIKGKFDVILGTGTASIAVGGKTIATISDTKNGAIAVSKSIDNGANKRVVRISGSNFVLVGLASVSTTLGDLKLLDRSPVIADPSLKDLNQLALSAFGFRSDDFSQEWTLLPMANGTTLIDPSLDLCNGTFASEEDRIERRQVFASKPDSTFSFLSTEVVRYSSANAASNAQKELVKVLSQCVADKGYKDATGALVPYTFSSFKSIPAGVVSEANRVFVNAVIDTGVNARALLGFYQFNGDIFTGLYVMNKRGFTEAQVEKWLKIAATMGQRLGGKSV